ncbi:MAG: acetolactate synthase small subunit [Dehalococcoidia bacterium]|nr:acetolactate synthase small subunit [Dehalococcoidia bacterium]
MPASSTPGAPDGQPATTTHTVAALVEDRPGVLNRVASMFRRRGFNIASLAVGVTEEEGVSRMTIVVEGPPEIGDQVQKQLDKMIDVITVETIQEDQAVTRELALIKVSARPDQRREIIDLIDIFRASVVDVSATSLIIQLTAAADTLDALVENLRPYGIREMVRTGRIALARGPRTTAVHQHEPEALRRFHQEAGRFPGGDLPYASN